jgi:hypothetical protein
MKKSKPSKYLVIAITFAILGIISFFLTIESAQKPNIFGENQPHFAFLIAIQSFFIIFSGISFGKWVSLKKSMK